MNSLNNQEKKETNKITKKKEKVFLINEKIGKLNLKPSWVYM